MSLDTVTLYLVATMVAAMLGAMLLFFGADGCRIGVRAPQDNASALARDRSACSARCRADAADPAWRSVARRWRHVIGQHLGDDILRRAYAVRDRHCVRHLHPGVGAHGDRAQDGGVDGSADRHV